MNIRNLLKFAGHGCVWMLFAFGAMFHGDISNLMQANSISQLKHDPIDKFVYPYQKTVDWASYLSLTKQTYDNLSASVFIDPVKYNPQTLGSLENMNSLSDLEINSRMTYSVPYMGNYKYDGQEYAGSHPGVDIKLPFGSPIVAIANGIVTKVKVSEVGFGNHVVIRHNHVHVTDGVPEESIYSTYGHLSDIFVRPGDIVNTGQVFARSGNSGLSTGAHLNFQIEKDTAAWHPYWPFSDTEIYAAGLNFVSGINQKYGFADAIQHTLNPLVFIDQYNDRSVHTMLAIQSTSQPAEPTESTDAQPAEHGETSVEGGTLIDKLTEPIQEFFVAAIESDVDSFELEAHRVNKDRQIPSSTGTSIYNEHEVSFVSENVEVWIPSLMRLGKQYQLNVQSDLLDLRQTPVQLMFNKPVEVVLSTASENLLSYQIKPLTIGSITLEALIEDTISPAIHFDVVSFNDININHELYQEIKLLSTLGFINGDKNHNLELYKEVTAAEAIKMLVLLLEYQGYESEQKYTGSNYSSSDWFNGFVDAALAYGIIESSGWFDVNTPVSLDQFLMWYYKATDKYVSANIKRHLARYIRPYGVNKLFVQQAILDELILVEKLSKQALLRKDLFELIYYLVLE